MSETLNALGVPRELTAKEIDPSASPAVSSAGGFCEP
jgi:hypothetical protein